MASKQTGQPTAQKHREKWVVRVEASTPRPAGHLRTMRHAVDDWARWATGRPLTTARMASMVDVLATGGPELTALAAAVERWAPANGIDLGPQQPISRETPASAVGLGGRWRPVEQRRSPRRALLTRPGRAVRLSGYPLASAATAWSDDPNPCRSR
jgi:hypothetical protein